MAVGVLDDDGRFGALQSRLRPFSDVGDERSGAPRTVIAIPSVNLGEDLLRAHAAELPALEERCLYLVFALRRPEVRLVVVTSRPIREDVVACYLQLVADVPGARDRLDLVSPDDASPRPLACKLLERPGLVGRIARLAAGEAPFIMPFNVREAERDLALMLDVPIYGVDSRFAAFGTKTGGRRLFDAVGVPHPRGVEAICSRDELLEAVLALRADVPGLAAAVVKHDDAVYGEGNHVLRLSDLPAPGTAEERSALDVRLRSLPAGYLRTLTEGGIVEEMIGGEIRSPSVQLRILPGGRPVVISTHDQVLGGKAGQSFVGCTFPASPQYARLIADEARKVGEHLAGRGVIGRFGVDFVVARRGDTWMPYALEINLREGGTSHPYGALWLLTDGSLDDDTVAYLAPDGQPKHYFATDRLAAPAYRGIALGDLLAGARRERLDWDPGSQTGAIFHMLSLLERDGGLGVTAIADSPQGAHELYLRVVDLLERLASRR